MTTPTYTELWKALTPEERREACADIWTASDETSRHERPAILAALGNALHFREKFLRVQSEDKWAGWLLLRAGQPEFRKFHGDLLRAWLLARHTALIENFLDVQGISHEGAFLKGTPPPPEEAALRKGVRILCEQSTMHTACLYLGFTLASDESGFWTALPAAISAESLDLSAGLAGGAR